ncbi:hypothetical protein IFM89_000162 [Coptis chinensis]|uniref:Pectin acetylesterase n=1 Tax=Coptis chinensis TaxID=261450 RepID=A0A835LKR0_9MAGN|nr:hypothetical protein IFM89_000162 [Coptis chinensis]
MASHRGVIWLRKLGNKDYIIISLALLLLIIILTTFDSSSPPIQSTTPNPPLGKLSLLRNAKSLGAVCLDGSPPGYHFRKGFGSGSRNWLLHIEGGGWCNSIKSCSLRQLTALGSSNFMEHEVPFSGILSEDALQNPDFFNWNKVKIRYCDGASLSGNAESEFHNGTKLFFRGRVIWKAIIDEIMSKGLGTSKQALLSGCSAGGLATLIHCDDFREILPKNVDVKCLADASFFLDESDISGNYTMRSFYRDVVHLQCFFPQEILKNTKTPIFLVNPAYDFWQIQNILSPDASDLYQSWQHCKRNIKNCNPNQLDILHGFRSSLLKAVNEFLNNKDGGVFINSCFIHCQTFMASTWHSPNSPRVNNKTIAEAVGDWYFNRKAVKEIDCPYPCNPTCHNMDFS